MSTLNHTKTACAQGDETARNAGFARHWRELFAHTPDVSQLSHSHSRKRGLYIHIPFCASKCSYCDFASFVASEGQIDDYLGVLRRELDVIGEIAAGDRFTSVFLGGGTPTVLGPERLRGLARAIRDRFTLSVDCEWTCEANPESATEPTLAAARESGISRLSLGVQSFDADELRTLGRIHDVRQPVQAAEVARQAGFDNINVDLIFGLPEQRPATWRETLCRALEMGAEHLSIYGLTLEGDTPLQREVEEGARPEPDEDAYLAMEAILNETLPAAGYTRYEISNWSKPGWDCRHNRLCWRQGPWLGAGVSAHTFWRGRRYRHSADLRTYIEAGTVASAQAGVMFDIHDLELIDERREAEDAMIFGLRLLEGIDAAIFADRYGYRPQDRWGDEIDNAVKRGWLTVEREHIRLTPKAIPVSNELFVLFLDQTKQHGAR